MSFLSFLFGNKDKRVLRQLGSVVNSINDLEEQFESLSDEELKNITSKLKEKLSEVFLLFFAQFVLKQKDQNILL